jgi:hypothetical protein
MSVMPIFGGYLYFGHIIPALPALIMEDAFGLAALALIWIMYRIRVTDADRALLAGTTGTSGAGPAVEPLPLAGRPAG